MIPLPASFAAAAARSAEMAAFLDRLPGLVRDLLGEWGLVPDGPATHGFTALVLPVRDAGGASCVLKVGLPHPEAEHEHLALRHWNGRGAVRLLRADPRRSALLLERLHGTDLSGVWDLEACEVVGSLYALLHVPAPPQLRTVTSYVDRWTDRLAELPRSALLPRRLVDQAVSLGRAFAADPHSTGTMVHGDLHYANVLAADRAPWLAIDPKPMSGDPHYEVAPMLWNRWAELAGDVRRGVRARFHALVDAAGLDEDRARDWVVVRMLHLALFRLEEPPGAPQVPSTDEVLTMCVSIAKAVQE